MLFAIAFLVASAGLAFVSRHSLRDRQSHGFYRFLAWECMLGLALHNVPFWFEQRFAWYQLLSWLLLLLSLGLVVWGAGLLARHGASDSNRHDPALFGFEKTARLVTHGIYAYIRHPLYSSLLLLAWGLYFKLPQWWPGLLLAIAATVVLVITAYTEERENLDYFGTAYRDYMQDSKRFVPFLF